MNLLAVTPYLQKSLSAVLLTSTIVLAAGSLPVSAHTSSEPSIQQMAQANTLQLIAEEFLQHLIDRNFLDAMEYLHPVLQKEWDAETLRQKWIDGISILGEIKGWSNPRVVENVVFLALDAEKLSDDIIIIFDEEQRIMGIDFPQITEDIL